MSKAESQQGGSRPHPSTLDSHPSTLLFIKPGSLGDVVHALPAAAALHDAWPDTSLTWVVDPRWAPILSNNPAVDRRLLFPREQFRGIPGAMRAGKWFSELRSLKPDLAIDLQGLFRSAMIATCARAKRKIGLSDAREGAIRFYDSAAEVFPTQHAVDRYLSILPLLGISIPARPAFPLPAGDAIDTPLPDAFILLHPYARGAGKSLDADQIRQLCEMLAPHPVVLAGVGQSPEALPSSVVDLTGRTTLLQLIHLLRQARTVISVDSGPMHLAAAVGARLLSIHTWSDPRKVGPYFEAASIWQGGEIRPQTLAATAPLLPERPLTTKDLEAIAAWATAQPGS